MTTVSTTDDGTIVEPVTNVAAASKKALEAAERRLYMTPTSALSILSVRWGVTVNTGNFSSVRLDAEAVVPMGGSAESTLQELRDWVQSQSPLNEYERSNALERSNRLRDELRHVELQVADAHNEYAKIKKVFETMGIQPGLPNYEDLPF